MYFPQKYIESRKIRLKSDIKITLSPKYLRIRRKLYYRTKRENKIAEKDSITSITFSQIFRSYQF